MMVVLVVLGISGHIWCTHKLGVSEGLGFIRKARDRLRFPFRPLFFSLMICLTGTKDFLNRVNSNIYKFRRFINLNGVACGSTKRDGRSVIMFGCDLN